MIYDCKDIEYLFYMKICLDDLNMKTILYIAIQ